jgi:hypothetical protein
VLASDTVSAHGESGVGVSMTTYFGSIKAMPGHIKVSTRNLEQVGRAGLEGSILWRLGVFSVVEITKPIPYLFILRRDKIYYVNGRNQVFETDIKRLHGFDLLCQYAIFDPVGRQWSPEHLVWRPIQFRPISKVEWVFL